MKATLGTLVLLLAGVALGADPPTCNLSAYTPMPGLAATLVDRALTVTWEGDHNQELRLRFAVASGTPTIQELAVRHASGRWGTLASNVTPDFRVMSGLRRMSNQQMAPLRGLGVDLTPAIVD